ncbi:MAG TPA: hypothetical protein VLN72_01835 [Gillisia sp.]|nr:hypothetical protein [Gillisia sp.]
MKLVIQLVLWVVIIFLGYLVFNAVYEPIQFNKLKEKRYAKVIERMQDIRAAQLAHREVTGKYAKDFDGLIQFVDTAEFVVVQRRDTTVMDEVYRKAYGVDRYMDIIIVDTLGYSSVKDSIFKSDRYKQMRKVPVEGVDAEFEMDAGSIVKNNNTFPVFEVKVNKSVILHDQDKDLVLQEKQVMSVDGVNGEFIRVGSMEDVNTSGNWPQLYGSIE